MRRESTFVWLAVAAAVCAACSPQRDRSFSAIEHAPGTWGWKGDLATNCKTNPHTISFSADKSLMYLRHAQPADSWDGKKRLTVHYRVERSSPELRHSLIGETRRTDEGERVAWDLFMISRDEYCWHRADWPEEACTNAIERCPPTEGP
jgi:hypothetical protein